MLVSRFVLGVRVCLASVSVDDVRDVINVSSAEVPDSKVLNMVKRDEPMLGIKTDREIDYSNQKPLKNENSVKIWKGTFPAKPFLK